MSDTTADRLVWRQELTERMKCSSETIRRWLKEGKLPKPDVCPTGRTQAWRLSTLRAVGFNLP